jgi:hypothetical protein
MVRYMAYIANAAGINIFPNSIATSIKLSCYDGGLWQTKIKYFVLKKLSFI